MEKKFSEGNLNDLTASNFENESIEIETKNNFNDDSSASNGNFDVERAIADTMKRFNLGHDTAVDNSSKKNKTVVNFNAQKFIKNFFDEVLDSLKMECEVKIKFNGRIFYVEICGEEANFFIGKHGILLYSWQNILNLSLKKHGLKLLLDAAGYREKRKNGLSRHAIRSAQTVLRTGMKYVFEPMDSWDRMVVHEALHSVPGILTHTEGDDNTRHVVVELNLANVKSD